MFSSREFQHTSRLLQQNEKSTLNLPWDYGVELHCEGENIEVAFQPLPPADIMATVKMVHDEPDIKPSKEANKECHPTFGPHFNTKVADFDFQKEVECLPFKLNLGDIFE